MKWAWKGIFAMEIPDDWQVKEDGLVIEVVPAVAKGAVQVSVLRRDLAYEVEAGESRRLLESFATGQGVRNPPIREAESSGEYVARSEFESRDGFRRYFWEVETRVWRNRALVCSLCFDGRDETLRERVRRMFQSIEPLHLG